MKVYVVRWYDEFIAAFTDPEVAHRVARHHYADCVEMDVHDTLDAYIADEPDIDRIPLTKDVTLWRVKKGDTVVGDYPTYREAVKARDMHGGGVISDYRTRIEIEEDTSDDG